MGAPKALLQVGDDTFLERLVDAMRCAGCDPVVVVVGPEAEDGARRVASHAREIGATVVVNPVAGSEQIDSLREALRSLDVRAEAVVMSPVDSPGATPRLIGRLLAAAADGAAVAIPTFEGRRGHPVVFAGRVVPELLAGDLPEGARTVIHRHSADVVEVPADDPAVLLDVDTPEDFERLRGAG